MDGWAVVEHGPADVVVRTSLPVAPLAQHSELVRDLVRASVAAREDVAGVGVLRDQPEGLPLTAAADHDRRVRSPERLWRVDRLRELVVLAVVGPVLVAPHLVHDLEGLLQSFEAFREWREGHAEAAVLPLVPGRPDAEGRTPPGEHIERRHDLGEQPGVPEVTPVIRTWSSTLEVCAARKPSDVYPSSIGSPAPEMKSSWK